MRMWGWVRQFPKVALVVGVLVGSTLVFAMWWFSTPSKTGEFGAASGEVAKASAAAAQAPAWVKDFKKLILADNNLVNVETGEVIVKGWLKHGMPSGVWFDDDSAKVIARYSKGFVRYNLDGKPERDILMPSPAFLLPSSDDLLFVKEADIWRAEIDWAAFVVREEKAVTAIEEFVDEYFPDNILMVGEKVLLVRNKMQLLRVDLETGETRPSKFPAVSGMEISPGKRFLIGDQNGTLFCYDIETDRATTLELGKRVGFQDYQWLDEDRCLALDRGGLVKLFSREDNKLDAVAELPKQCRQLGIPSPHGRYVFASSEGGRGFLVDTEGRKASPVRGGTGVAWMDAERFMFARDTQNSELRGTWTQKVEETEQRVSPRPYLVPRGGSAVLPLPGSGLVVFYAKDALCRMNSDGTDFAEVAEVARPPSFAIPIGEWQEH